MKAFCCSVNADAVVIVLSGGGDTSILHVIMELVQTFCIEKWWGMNKIVKTALMPCSKVTLVHKKVFRE